MAFDQAAVNALIDAAVSHAMTTGAFRSVNSHEPKTAPGKGLTASVWAQSIRPVAAGSGLAATSGVVTLNLRIYGNMLQQPEDDIDPRLIAAMTALMSEYTGDFTFGGTIRNIDLLGMYGETLSADAGYLEMQGSMYRIMTLTIPCVINDLWVQGGIPSAEETPGRSLQVDSLGVTGGASIGGALTVGGAADVTGLFTASGGIVITDVPNPSGTLPIGYGNSKAVTGLQIVSSYPSDDVPGGTDGTGRINLYSYQRAGTYSFGELIRKFLMRWDAKAMLAHYVPVTGTAPSLSVNYDVNGNVPSGSSWGTASWVGTHYESTGHTGLHSHWEVEIPDANGQMQGRFAILFGSESTGSFGLDKTIISTNLADFHVLCHGSDHTGAYQEQYLRLVGASGYEKPIEWNNDDLGSTSNRRWKLASTADAESGSNAGTNWTLYRYDDGGTYLGNPFTITRSTGAIQLGDGNSTAPVTVTRSGGSSLAIVNSATGAQAIQVTLADSTSVIMEAEASGDTVNRFYLDVNGRHQWGSGSASRDVNLYRASTATLATDSALTVGGMVTASGGLLISDVPSPSGSLPVGYGNSEAVTGLQIASSYPSDDVDGGTDGTGRIDLYSYQRANSYSFGETLRNFLMRYDAKAMHAWYGPTGGSSGTLTAAYDGSGNATGSNWRPWTWAGSHYEANDHGSIHGHYEIEIPDTTGALEGRLIIPFVDDNPNSPVYGQIGITKTNIRLNQADLTMDSGWGVIRVGGTAGVNDRAFELASSIYSSNTGAVRWRILANNTAESGSNVGSDFAIRRFSDTGTLLGTGLFMSRATGAMALGSGGTGLGQLTVNYPGSGNHGVEVLPAANTGSNAAYHATMFDSTSRLLLMQISGEANARFLIDSTGAVAWGAGSAARDTNLYRNGVALLQTDGSLTLNGSSSNLTVGGTGHISGNVGIGTAPGALALQVVSGTAGQTFQVQRNTTSDGTPMAVFLAGDTSTAQAVGVSVVGDTSNRFAIDPAGKVTWGSGSASRDVELYRSSANVLATDHWLRASLGFRVNTTDVGSGAGVIAMAPASTVPTSNPSSLGVVVYVDASGNLVCRTSAGNVRTIAAV